MRYLRLPAATLRAGLVCDAANGEAEATVLTLFCFGFFGVLAFLSISNLAPVVLFPWRLSASLDASPARPQMPWPE